MPIVRVFGPLERPPRGTIQLTLEELEALKLVDHEDLDQEKAAVRMGISRKSFWLDLRSARKKVAKALVDGLAIQIQGGSYVLRMEDEEEYDQIAEEAERRRYR